MIHTVEKVLLPPGGNTIEVLKNNGRFTKFMQLLEFSELENDFSSSSSAHTILAPTDEAFEKLHDELKDKYLTDKDIATRLVENHVLNDVVCCAGIPRHVPFFLDRSGRRTRAGEVVSLRKSAAGHIYADKAEVTHCDTVAENGVVHALDRVLVPQDLRPEEPKAKQQTELPFYIIKLFK